MREIKYRAWDKDRKEMAKVHSIHLNTQKVILTGICFGGNRSVPFDEIELMEYTGLKDKNGKEIYEGDIALYEPFETHNNDRVIAYENGAFYGKLIRNGYGELLGELDSLNVIGNIHENPELLER